MSQKTKTPSLKTKLPSLKPKTPSLKNTMSSLKQSIKQITNINTSTEKSTGTLSFFTNLCPQAKIYAILNLITIILGIIILGNNGLSGFIYNVILTVFWVWLVSGLCERGWNKVAWTFAIIASLGLLITIIVQMIWGSAALKEHIEKNAKTTE